MEQVPARLQRAVLFGSVARGEGRPNSDLDVLLVFNSLPPDREPQAGIAEAVADAVAARTGVPLEVWSVSLADLAVGHRTPMLVDALDDGIPLWPPGAPRLAVRFTPVDAAFCVAALLRRVEEGSAAVLAARCRGQPVAVCRRVRDDLVRCCTAALLLAGVTRPRRAAAVRAACLVPALGDVARRHAAVLAWAADSFGPGGRAEELPLLPPPGGCGAAARAVEALRGRLAALLEVAERGHFLCAPGLDQPSDRQHPGPGIS